jgi:hypothetical protein
VTAATGRPGSVERLGHHVRLAAASAAKDGIGLLRVGIRFPAMLKQRAHDPIHDPILTAAASGHKPRAISHAGRRDPAAVTATQASFPNTGPVVYGTALAVVAAVRLRRLRGEPEHCDKLRSGSFRNTGPAAAG